MQVIAVSTIQRPDWRWRIVNDAGETVEESANAFSTIALAVGAGSRRLQSLDTVDRSVRANPYRRTTHLRGR